MKRTLKAGLILVALCACVFFIATLPRPLTEEQLPDHVVNIDNGETMFWAGGCASCHAKPDANEEELLSLSGGIELGTPFGTFRAPNISPDSNSGIGSWSTLEFVNAMVRGLSPDMEHYYPAFPFPHYQNMMLTDVIDLKAYLDTLPASTNSVDDHDLNFPYSIRRGLGLWKHLYTGSDVTPDTIEFSTPIERGRYLVRGPAHCGACHTPRDRFGGEINDRFLAGADSLELSDDGTQSGGRIPNITPHSDGIGSWSESDIAYSLESGFDPDFDSFGGSMVHVQENMAKLSAEDRLAIASYLKSIPEYPSD